MGENQSGSEPIFMAISGQGMGKNVRLRAETAIERISSVGVTWRRYLGIVNRKKMGPIEKRALTCYGNIINRTQNPNVQSFKHYSHVKMEIDSRDFIGWYIAHYHSRTWKIPSVGRIDHSRGYSLDNIEMQEMSDNAKERISRKGNPSKNPPRPIYLLNDNNEPLRLFPSSYDAARFLGIGKSTPSESAKRKTWTKRTKYRFAWADEFKL